MREAMSEIDQAFFLKGEVDWLDTRVRRDAIRAAVSLVLYVATAIIVQVAWVAAVPAVFAIVCVVRMYCTYLRREGVSRTYWDLVDRLYWKLSHERQSRVRECRSGWFGENILAEYECQDAHLPGDCPLCGAT